MLHNNHIHFSPRQSYSILVDHAPEVVDFFFEKLITLALEGFFSENSCLEQLEPEINRFTIFSSY